MVVQGPAGAAREEAPEALPGGIEMFHPGMPLCVVALCLGAHGQQPPREDFAAPPSDRQPGGGQAARRAAQERQPAPAGRPELVAQRGHSNEVTSAAFSPDGRCVLTGGQDGTARLWEAATGKELRTLRGHTGWVYSVAFS